MIEPTVWSFCPVLSGRKFQTAPNGPKIEPEHFNAITKKGYRRTGPGFVIFVRIEVQYFEKIWNCLWAQCGVIGGNWKKDVF